jgi:hypothetical protein
MKKTLIVLLLLALVGVGAFAQVGALFDPMAEPREPSGYVAAPSNNAAGNRVGDWYVDLFEPTAYKIPVEQWGAFASFAPGFASTPAAAAFGFGTKLGNDMFLAAYYGGNGFSGFLPVSTTTESGGPADGKAEREKFTTYDFGQIAGFESIKDNRVAVLFGVADMGFRLGYATTYDSFNAKDVDLGPTPIPQLGFLGTTAPRKFDEISAANGMQDIELTWGMTKALTSVGFQPEVNATIRIVSNNAMFDVYGEAAANPKPFTAHSANYLEPSFYLATGNFTLARQGGFAFRADLMLQYTMRTYSNEASYIGENFEVKTVSITGTNIWTTNALGAGDPVSSAEVTNDQSYSDIFVRPRVQFNWTGENVGLNARFVFGNNFISESYTELNASGDALKDLKKAETATVSTSTYKFSPEVQLGARYDMNERLTLRFGGRISLGNITSTTTETKDLSEGDYKDSTKTEKSATFADFRPGFTTGFAFKLTENLIVDTISAVNGGNGVALLGNFLTFSRIMVVLKF